MVEKLKATIQSLDWDYNTDTVGLIFTNRLTLTVPRHRWDACCKAILGDDVAMVIWWVAHIELVDGVWELVRLEMPDQAVIGGAAWLKSNGPLAGRVIS